MIKLLSGTEFNSLLPARRDNSHKRSFGTLGLVCGSLSYQGAATFATLAALHTGVGIAVSFIPECIYVPFASKINGAVIETLKSNEAGSISDPNLSFKILKRKCTALVCGSGLGLSDASAKTVHQVSELSLPIVFDGDALSVIASDKSILDRNNTTVVTPHIGEFSKLCSKSPEYVRKNRVRLASDFAKEYNCYVVLKDYVTVIAAPGGNCSILSNPTSALSKGGSGDLLAGMLGSFVTQDLDPYAACQCAVTLHNACGKFCENKYGAYFTQPDNIIDSISKLVK